MIKLLIADDEPLVCVGLRSMLKWSELGIEVSGSARNGQEAAEMIDLIKPDIVIADIKMPVMTGIELAEDSLKRNGRIPLFIMLTSYEEFDYARRALQAHVVDYLVKLELTPEILQSSVERALSTLAELKHQEAVESAAGFGGVQVNRERFFLRLYNNLFENSGQYSKLLDEAAIDFKTGPFACAICTVTEPPVGELPDGGLIKQYECVMQMVHETLSDAFHCYVTPLDMHSFCAAICLDWDNSQEDQPLLKNTLANIIDMVRGYMNISLRIAVGHLVDDPRYLAESYNDARRLCPALTASQPLKFSDRRRNYRHQLIMNVQKYILDNLQSHLSLNEVAVVFSISPSYLSQLFTKTVGESFVEYITGARIAAAKEMLADGTMKIYEVAETLGFRNAFYFSKVFKKIEGISPREYLKRLFGTEVCEEKK